MKCVLLYKNIFCQKVIEILSFIGIGVERVVLRTLVAALTILQLTCSIRKVFAWKILLFRKFLLVTALAMSVQVTLSLRCSAESHIGKWFSLNCEANFECPPFH